MPHKFHLYLIYFIFFQEYIHIFSDHGVELQPDEVERVSSIANEDGEVTKEEFLAYAKSSDFFKTQG